MVKEFILSFIGYYYYDYYSCKLLRQKLLYKM